ncbi:MAG: hypothetical protein KBC00_04275 [Candidatus Levybacteria bacterium]|nr:hypothetical protein [Candidatus Levybacteria bacterium]
MSTRLHEGPQRERITASILEKRLEYRLADLAKLKTSPVVSLALDRAASLIEQGQRAIVGISTDQAIEEGADPTICLITNLTKHGEYGNKFDPEKWMFGRVDLVGISIGDNPLRVTVRGRDSKHMESGMPHKVTDIKEIEEALDQALLNPRTEITSFRQDNANFPVKGFKRLATSETK